jgi:TonB-dependent SusC/RagA subfamily outer membrane receptor
MARPPAHALVLVALGALLAGCAASGPAAGEAEADEVDVGYGTQPAAHVTGAVSRVDPDAVAQVPARTIEELLVGRVAGLRMTTLPGGRQQLLIRGRTSIYGSNEPLYVVDGVPLLRSAGGLTGINPADVESIEVIRDGQAAIYGSRGANGVILIRTKGGRR